MSQAKAMVILRATQKLRSALPPTADVPDRSDTALGDWYVNRLVVDRQSLLLLVSAASLLPLLVPARDVRNLPGRLGDLVEARLQRVGVDRRAIAFERRAMGSVIIRPTADRSVLGIMVDFARAVPHYLDPWQWTIESLRRVEDRLAETPCYAGQPRDRVIFPESKAQELLHAKWLPNAPVRLTQGRKRAAP